jgi:hypothetical protein
VQALATSPWITYEFYVHKKLASAGDFMFNEVRFPLGLPSSVQGSANLGAHGISYHSLVWIGEKRVNNHLNSA